MKVGLAKTSLVNFPGRVAAVVFLPGCNLRCPFCHNAALAAASAVSGPKGDESEGDFVELEEVFDHLERRKNVISGLAISGGEPVLSSALYPLIAAARGLGLAVKVDTNGTLSDRLFAMLENAKHCPDMIAVDVKTSPERYAELAAEPSAGERAGGELLRTLDRLSRPNPGFARAVRVEYRTVLVPGLAGESEIREISRLIPSGADWQLANFATGACLDPAWNAIEPYGPHETKRLISIARERCAGAKLR